MRPHGYANLDGPALLKCLLHARCSVYPPRIQGKRGLSHNDWSILCGAEHRSFNLVTRGRKDLRAGRPHDLPSRRLYLDGGLLCVLRSVWNDQRPNNSDSGGRDPQIIPRYGFCQHLDRMFFHRNERLPRSQESTSGPSGIFCGDRIDNWSDSGVDSVCSDGLFWDILRLWSNKCSLGPYNIANVTERQREQI